MAYAPDQSAMNIPLTYRERAFTVLEGLVVVVVLLLLLAILLPTLNPPRRHASQFNCVNNLKQVGIDCRIWEGDHGDNYPMNVPVAQGGAQELIATGNVAACFQVMSNELATPKLLVCSADTRHIAATNFAMLRQTTNLSYFIGFRVTENDPQASLSGDANLMQNGHPVSAGILDLWTNTACWTRDRHGEVGYVLFTDDSVQPVRQIGFTSAAGTDYATNRIVAP